jgi:potassium efflux system protein
VEASETLDETEKNTQLEYLRQAQKWLASAEECTTKTNQYAAESAEAPAELEQAKQQLEEALPEPNPQYSADATLAQLEQTLGQFEEELKAAQQQLAQQSHNADSNTLTERKAAIAQQKEAAKGKLEEADSELKGAGTEEGIDAMPAARRLELQARRRFLAKQMVLLDAERAHLEAHAELFPIRRDLAQRQAAWHEKLVEAWREVVSDRRKAESERQAAEARRIASQAHPALKELAERNAELAEGRTQLADQMEKVAGYLDTTSKILTELKEDYANVSKKVKAVGMTPTIGMLLRDRRDRLPVAKMHKERIGFCGAEMQRVQAELFELEKERSEMGDMDQRIEQAVEELGTASAGLDPASLNGMLRDLLRDRRDYLDGMLADYRSYHDDLNDLAIASRDLIDEVTSYRSYIDENVLWIRSAHPAGLSDLSSAWQALPALVDPGRWKAAKDSVWQNAKTHLWASVCLACIAVVLFLLRGHLSRRLKRLSEQATSGGEASLLPTIQIFALTILIVAVRPAMFWGVGWWLTLSANVPDLVLGLARGLQAVALSYFAVGLLRQVCRPGGLGEKHFGWQSNWRLMLYRNLSWLMVLGLPIVLLVTLFDKFDGGAWKGSLGRLAMLAGLLLLTAFLHRVLHPWWGVLQTAVAGSTARWPARFRYVWYVVGIGFPVTLIVLTAMGYTYTAERLISRSQHMVLLILAVVLGQALFARGLNVAWKRLANIRATMDRQRRVALASQGGSQEATPEEKQTDVRDISLQLGQLVRGLAVITLVVGTWFVWADMFPALQVFDRVELWSTTRMVSETTTDAEGLVTTATLPKTVPVTLADLFLVALIVGATIITTRALPGLMEVAISGRLPIDTGARHAIAIISRYTVTLVGVIAACSMLGMKWSSVQWLAAAMTVGLGFGLQEIFANLVSGLIILFERPIRIGDLVTVNGTTGRVTRMQIRSTTITDFDRRELVVPNKRFITDDVVNWTLSDPITRFVIPVGIAYGCDPAVAEKLLLRVADEHPLVLREPAPTAVFVGFGASTLDLELRAFLGNRDHYGTALHEINLAIDKEFRAAGLEIAFPQQDLHIRDIDLSGLSGLLSTAPQQPPQGREAA